MNGVVLELDLPDGVMDARRCTCNDYAPLGRRAVADAGRWATFRAHSECGKMPLSRRYRMSTAREEIARLVEAQPADSSREEIVREPAFHVMVQRGLADSDAKRIVSNTDMAHRIRAWRK